MHVLDEIDARNLNCITPNVGEAHWLISRVRELEAALEFYADPLNWGYRTSGHGESSRDAMKDDGGYTRCAGKRAREALLGGKDEKQGN